MIFSPVIKKEEENKAMIVGIGKFTISPTRLIRISK